MAYYTLNSACHTLLTHLCTLHTTYYKLNIVSFALHAAFWTNLGPINKHPRSFDPLQSVSCSHSLIRAFMCTLYYTLYTAHCTEHFILQTAHFRLQMEYCTLNTAHCLLHTPYCTLHTAYRKLHTVACTLHTAHCTVVINTVIHLRNCTVLHNLVTH